MTLTVTAYLSRMITSNDSIFSIQTIKRRTNAANEVNMKLSEV